MKHIPKNKPLYQWVNKLTYRWVMLTSKAEQEAQLAVDEKVSPLWVTGFFRSGTSLTTRLLGELGMDLGPVNHLLQAKGRRADWNPQGFYENYLFMDWSLSVFEELGAWGHEPPSEEAISTYDVNQLDYRRFVHESVVQIHDDRISNADKAAVLKRYFPRSADLYLQEQFSGQPAIKNPHFMVLAPLLNKHWPKGRYLVVYRNPEASLSSAQKVADNMDYALYTDYYSRLINEADHEVVYFSYDALLRAPASSLQMLIQQYDLNENRLKKAMQCIRPNLYRHKKDLEIEKWPKDLQQLYAEMEKRAINTI